MNKTITKINIEDLRFTERWVAEKLLEEIYEYGYISMYDYYVYLWFMCCIDVEYNICDSYVLHTINAYTIEDIKNAKLVPEGHGIDVVLWKIVLE